MGSYTDNLTRRHRKAKDAPDASERLVAAALIRDGVTESRGFKSHREIRAALGDEDPAQSNPADKEGFLTSKGRFVDRSEAMLVGDLAGQCSPMLRPLLSSDIRW